jgi:hypothetical protein
MVDPFANGSVRIALYLRKYVRNIVLPKERSLATLVIETFQGVKN